MRFGILGIDYHATSLDERSVASFRDSQKVAFYADLYTKGIKQAVILVTCNRSEVYYFFDSKTQCDLVEDAFLTYSAHTLKAYIYHYVDEVAIQYFLEVCAGYHSMIQGEDQIFHQVQEAYALSNQSQACGKQMHKIMQSSFAFVKQIKTTYRMNEVSVSLAALTMQKVQTYGIPLRTAMIIGNGDMALSLMPYAKAVFPHITLCTRSKTKVQAYVDHKQVHWMAFHERYHYIANYDVIFCATASPHAILIEDLYPNVAHPQIFIDFASPRDIALLNHKQRIYIDLDHMRTYVDAHLEERKRRLKNAHDELMEKASALYTWLQTSMVDPYIENIQEKAMRMAVDTYTLLIDKLELNTHEANILHKHLKTSFYRLSAEWVDVLKQLTQDEDMQRQLQACMQKENV